MHSPPQSLTRVAHELVSAVYAMKLSRDRLAGPYATAADIETDGTAFHDALDKAMELDAILAAMTTQERS